MDNIYNTECFICLKIKLLAIIIFEIYYHFFTF